MAIDAPHQGVRQVLGLLCKRELEARLFPSIRPREQKHHGDTEDGDRRGDR